MRDALMFLSKITIFLVLILLVFTSDAYASWYAWYQQSSYYGVWAIIWAPASAPFTPIGAGQSHSVSIPGPYWVQAGWRYYDGDSIPQKYYEYCAENCENDSSQYDLVGLGSHNWNSAVKYEVSYDGSLGDKTWCAWVGGVRQYCKDNIRIAPSTILIQSEVHVNPQSQINTEFSSIRIKNSTGIWVYPTLNGNLFNNFPYKAEEITSEHFRTYRIETQDIFLPLVAKQ